MAGDGATDAARRIAWRVSQACAPRPCWSAAIVAGRPARTSLPRPCATRHCARCRSSAGPRNGSCIRRVDARGLVEAGEGGIDPPLRAVDPGLHVQGRAPGRFRCRPLLDDAACARQALRRRDGSAFLDIGPGQVDQRRGNVVVLRPEHARHDVERFLERLPCSPKRPRRRYMRPRLLSLMPTPCGGAARAPRAGRRSPRGSSPGLVVAMQVGQRVGEQGRGQRMVGIAFAEG